MGETDQPNFTNSMIELISSRKSMAFIYTWTAAIGALIAGNGFPPVSTTIMALGASLFITLSVYLYNDVVDGDMDRASPTQIKKDRPLASGKVSDSYAMAVVISFAVIGLAISYAAGMLMFKIATVYFVLFSLYSFPLVRLKKMFIIKSLVTATGPSFTMILGGIAASGTIGTPILFAAAVQGTFMFFLLPGLADSFDIEEDRAFGVRTMAMVLSWTQKVQLMTLSVLVVMGAALYGYQYLGFNLSLPITVALLSIVMLSRVTKLFKGYNEEMARGVRKVAYAYFTFLPVFMAIGTMNLPFLL
ncbi:MAG: UbiA prenyltransferase family protein [Deltaproteobacteria bacterium]|nr:UbiA prenyltransferase family protein [Deltaproteobacteria bacterium]